MFYVAFSRSGSTGYVIDDETGDEVAQHFDLHMIDCWARDVREVLVANAVALHAIRDDEKRADECRRILYAAGVCVPPGVEAMLEFFCGIAEDADDIRWYRKHEAEEEAREGAYRNAQETREQVRSDYRALTGVKL